MDTDVGGHVREWEVRVGGFAGRWGVGWAEGWIGGWVGGWQRVGVLGWLGRMGRLERWVEL